MSEIIFIIKCIKCKSDFNQGDKSYRRICDGCRYNRDVAKRKRLHIKKEKKRKEIAQIKPKTYLKTCLVCEREFKTLISSKKYCTKKCKVQTSKISVQLENTEKNLVKLDARIIKVNELYEVKMHQLQVQLDYYNNNAEKQRLKYIQNMERLQLIQHRTGKEIAI